MSGRRIAVDFDNTLTQGDESYFTDGAVTPDRDMVQWVNERYCAGHTIIIWTARPWAVAGQTAAKLTEWGVRWHGLRCDKGSADQYVDDKTVRPEEIVGEDGWAYDPAPGDGGYVPEDTDAG